MHTIPTFWAVLVVDQQQATSGTMKGKPLFRPGSASPSPEQLVHFRSGDDSRYSTISHKKKLCAKLRCVRFLRHIFWGISIFSMSLSNSVTPKMPNQPILAQWQRCSSSPRLPGTSSAAQQTARRSAASAPPSSRRSWPR